MSRQALKSRSVSSVSVCGKILRKGQTITVPSSAVGPREQKMEDRGRIRIIRSNKKDKVQIRAI
tara:strand:- start:42 stop:233 length:192 start_codon:yes stop_codon:yes gene_type:complete